MDGVVVGNPIVREAHYFLNGNLEDPTAPRITIRDPLGVAVVTDATPTRISQGIYQYTYAVPLAALLGTYTDTWQGTLASQAAMALDYWAALPLGSIAPVPSSTYTYNLATDVGKLRFLIQDHDMTSVSTAIPMEQRSAAFTDEELAFVLTVRTDLFFAAATCLRVWAANKQLIIIARRVGKSAVEYGGIRADLLKAADAYETQALTQPADALVEQTWTDLSMRQLIMNEYIRQLV